MGMWVVMAGPGVRVVMDMGMKLGMVVVWRLQSTVASFIDTDQEDLLIARIPGKTRLEIMIISMAENRTLLKLCN